MRNAGQTVEDQENAFALRAQMFGDGCREHGAAQSQIGRVIRWNRDDSGFRRAIAGHVPGHEIGDFAGPFADQPHDDGIGLRIVDDHVHQYRFADAGSGHDTDALAHAEGGQRVQ